MPQPKGTLGTLGVALAALLQPLEERIAAGNIRALLAELGLQFPATIDTNAALKNAVGGAIQRLKDLPGIESALASAVENEDVPQIIAKGAELADAVRVVIEETEKIGAALKIAGAGAGIPAPELNQFADELPGRLIEYLAVRNLESIPGAAEALEFIGAVERTELPAVDPQHPAFIKRQLHVDNLTQSIQDPADHLKARYQWGAPAFDGVALLDKLRDLLNRVGVPAVLDTSGPAPVLDVVFLEVSPRTDITPPGLILGLAHSLEIDTTASLQQDNWRLRLVADTQLGVGVQVIVQPNDGVTFIPPSGQAQGDLLVEWTGGTSEGTPYLILGQPGGSRLEARQFVARAGVGLVWNSGANRAEGVFRISGEVKGGKVVVDLGDADGFLAKIFAGFGLESDFSLGMGFSTSDGIFFIGSSILEIQLPLHVSLGLIDVRALTISTVLAASELPIGIGLDFKAALGPLEVVVEQIGVNARVALPADNQGNAGPLDFHLTFRPPKGVGLSLDVGVVKGGGYLFIDPARGEYAGNLELALFDVVTLKAIGIISTKMPDGSVGFSLLIIMSVEFGSGIQLGFGFTLLAVGGLVGLNRTMNLQALAEGVRTGAIESVMFPKDVIANAPKIISDLRTFFPPRDGTFLIGPMLKIGWGTPTLASISLGVIIEIPGNVAIVGVLKIAVPADDVALIVLQVNFIGAIEPDKKRVWFFAALFESRIVFLTIDGEMGLLFAFGADANFVVSVGGFHPRFEPPPLPFPGPKRVAVSLLSSSVAKIRIEGYFAITSNTVQFGARVEVFFGLDILNVQGHLGFDALFQFSPSFFFIIEFSAALSVDVFGAGVFSVDVAGSLDGPSPWHVKGHGSISLLFWDLDVPIEKTWGEARNNSLPPIPILPIITQELEKVENWRALLPSNANLLVALRGIPDTEAALVLHPVGVLRISQRGLPLGIKLDTIGAQKPSDVNRLFVDVAGGGLTKRGDAFELFPPAQFQTFSDAERLSKPAFGPERSGLDLSVSGADARSAVMVRRAVRYEEIILDSNYKRFSRRFHGFLGVLFEFFLNGAAVTRCELSQAVKVKMQPFAEKIDVRGETYSVANQADNTPYTAESIKFHSEASAREYMDEQVAADPSLSNTIHVIPTFEMVSG